jgi:hypothetical protein
MLERRPATHTIALSRYCHRYTSVAGEDGEAGAHGGRHNPAVVTPSRRQHGILQTPVAQRNMSR